jgi:hypothetical protein
MGQKHINGRLFDQFFDFVKTVIIYIYVMGNTSPVHSEPTPQSHQSTIHCKPIMAL